MVDTGVVDTLLGQGFIPVIASVGVGPDGQAVNINADTFASALAQTCNASKVVFLHPCSTGCIGTSPTKSRLSAA